ncbi:MAG: 1-acyl-sn-glycerol-3-phosphate acyltransferase, partial [Nannocystaceae bacterium]
DLLFRVEKVAKVMRSVGIVPARRGTARGLLDDGRKMLVFPGGDIENMRPYRDRRKIVLAGRTGFLRQAIRTGAPIIPVVGAGNHETLMVLSQGRKLAQRLKLDRLFRIHSLPILLAAPWGILIGPTCALPYLPLPSKVTVELGYPIETGRRDPTGGSERRVSILYRHVELTMQRMLDALYEERRYPVVG